MLNEKPGTQVNGKLYTIAKVQSDKSCPLIANAPPSSGVRQFGARPLHAIRNRRVRTTRFGASNLGG